MHATKSCLWNLTEHDTDGLFIFYLLRVYCSHNGTIMTAFVEHKEWESNVHLDQ